MELLYRNDYIGIRERASNLYMYFGAHRHNEMRKALASDVFLMDWNGEGPQKCQALFLTMYETKSVKDGTLQYGASIRNRDWRVCPHFSLALMMNYRYTIMKEALPDLSNHEWYRICLFRQEKDNCRSVDYESAKTVL